MRRALIIGAGGTGVNVLFNTANFISARRKESISDLKNVEYFAIDTESAGENRLSIPDSDLNFQHLMVDEYQNNAFKQQRREGKHAWMDNDYCRELEPITDGAHATRVVGKYAFLQHYDAIRDAITTRLSRLRDIGAEQQEKTQVYVVANTASGTGSGCFVDLGIMIRDIIQKGGFNVNNASLRVTLIITLPTNYTHERNMCNSYFSLQELNHFMMGNSYEIDHVNGKTTIAFEGGRIFDYVYVIGKRDVADTNVTPLETLISEYIYNDIFSSSADVRDKERDNLKLVRGKGRGQKPLYMSFGLSVIEYPSSNILEAASCQYIENTLNEWLVTSDKSITSKYALTYFETEIFAEMIKQGQSPSGAALDYTAKVNSTRKNKIKSFRENDNNTKYLEDLKNTFDSGFSPNENSATTNTQGIARGDFHFILGENVKRLIAQVTLDVKTEILAVLFSGDVRNNTDFAKKSVTKIILKIQRLKSATPRDLTKHEKKLKETRRNIEDMKNIALLPKGFKSVRTNKYASEFEVAFGEYTKNKLYNETVRVMNAKIQVGDSMVNLLSTLEEQLNIFLENIIAFETSIKNWKIKIGEKFNKVIKTPDINGYVVKAGEISNLANKAVEAYSTSESKRSALIADLLQEKYNDDLMSNESQELIYDNDNVFFKVKKLHKAHMKPENVIDVFLSELRAGQKVASDDKSLRFAHKTVKDVANKSNPYLKVDERDDAFVVDKNLENKLSWVFYPDGKEIKTPETAKSGSNPLAKILAETYIIEDGRWDEKSQSSNDADNNKDMIIFLKEIGVFPIRFLEIIRDANMTNYMRNVDRADSTRIDRRGRYLPLIPPSKQEYDDIKIRLIKSIALMAIIPVAGEQKFVINDVVVRRGLSRDENEFSLSIRYDVAIPQLSDDADAREVLKTVFAEVNRNVVNDSTMFAEFVENLCILKVNPGKLGLIVSQDDLKEIDILIHNEVLKNAVIKEKWNEMYRDNQIVESTIHKHKIVRTTGGDSGFYCPIEGCNQWLGHLNDEEIVKNLSECPNCGSKLMFVKETQYA
jgi:hypothetical protein